MNNGTDRVLLTYRSNRLSNQQPKLQRRIFELRLLCF